MNISGLEACHRDLFTDVSELREIYPKDTVDKIIRVRDMYMSLLKTPSMTDAEMVRVFTQRYKVSRPTSYSDLRIVKVLLPKFGQSDRDFDNWRSKEMLLDTYRLARAKMDVRTMERAASSYARITHADELEEEKIDVSKIVPVPWVPTDNPEVLGLPPLPDRERKIRDLLREFSAQDAEILDVSFEEADTPAGIL